MNIVVQFFQEKIEHADSSDSIDVIISVDKNTFIFVQCIDDSVDCQIHVFDQMGVVEVFPICTEEIFYSFIRVDAPVEQYPGNNFWYLKLFCEIVKSFFIRLFCNDPLQSVFSFVNITPGVEL